MDQHDLSIFAQVDIRLYGVHSQLERQVEGSQGILRCMALGPAVPYAQHWRASRPQQSDVHHLYLSTLNLNNCTGSSAPIHAF